VAAQRIYVIGDRSNEFQNSQFFLLAWQQFIIRSWRGASRMIRIARKTLVCDRARALVLVFVAVCALSACLRNPPPFNESQWRQDVETRDSALLYAPNRKDGKYFNPWMPMDPGSVAGFLRWRFTAGDVYTEEEELLQPRVQQGLKARLQAMPEGDLIAWIGHGTFLIRLRGEYWITDPILSERALLPKRKTPPALSVDDLLELTGRLNVIVTHNHYDHLDKPTIEKLRENTRIFTPLGLKGYVRKLGKQHTEEMDWWQTADCGNAIKLICLPAQHWSMRFGQWRNTTLWAGFLLISPELQVFIGGDSGFFIGYREIGRKYPHIDYALLPLTAYQPRWFMHYAHMDALETLDAFKDLNAKTLIPTQWGAFRLGNEPVGYPAIDLTRRIKEKNLDPASVMILDLGEIVVVPPKVMRPSSEP
jgi:N-acyl-phosphatidylethanolamine-hydrolysing phospholipase D